MMDNIREKLVELLREVQYLGGLEEKIADHLIANGVTIEKPDWWEGEAYEPKKGEADGNS